MNLNKQYFTCIWAVLVCLILLPISATAQGWEIIEEDQFEIPNEIIAPSRGGYISLGTTIVPGSGTVLQLERVDLEGDRVFSKNFDVIDNIAGAPNGLTINEFAAENTFIMTGPKIGIVKINHLGNFEWQHDAEHLNLPADHSVVWSSVVDENQAYITTGGSNNLIAGLARITTEGTAVWATSFNDQPFDMFPLSNITTNDGGCAILGEYEAGGETGAVIIRTNSDGEELWTQQYPGLYPSSKTLVQNQLGDILFVSDGPADNMVYRVDDNEGTLTEFKPVTQDILSTVASLLIDEEGNYILTGHRIEDNLSKPTLMKFNSNGNEIWTRLHQISAAATIVSTTIDKENKVISYGQYLLDQPNIFATGYRIAVDENGEVYDNYITGNVFADNNDNCQSDAGDALLSNWLILADGEIDFYGVTDEEGNYSIPVPVGDYTVSVSSPSIFYNPCTPSFNVVATDDPATFSFDFGMQAEEECPYLQVEISVPFLRFCNEQVYYVDYCNYGTVAATNVSVEVVLDDELLEFVNSSIAPSTQNNNVYTFDIPGTLGVGECGQFTITTQLTCDEEFVGSTVCVEATISPLCEDYVLTTPHLVVEGTCVSESDSIRFRIRNIGNATSVQSKTFIVIEDHLVLNVGEIPDEIMPGNFVDRTFPSNEGATMNFLIEQESNFPTLLFGDPYASSTVEGCVGVPNAPYTYNNFLDDDGEVWMAEDCQEIVSSFDPNDKQVIPNGVDEEEHYTLPNTTMEYKVRFQNTGTDTAFLVVIRDTISEHLDLTTFVPGASSHPYRYEILNDGYIKFSFENILLVDSTTNEPASHGFVKYTIRQNEDLIEGTIIENCAAIYFDFNSPVFTNCTWNTIRLLKDWVVVNTDDILNDPQANLKVYPNPFVDYVNFEIVNDQFSHKEKNFTLYNSNGQLIHSENFVDSSYQFHKRDLPEGMYFYEIQQDGAAVNSGKLILQ